jgi:hypothetical protein
LEFAVIRVGCLAACVCRRRVVGPDGGLCAEPGFLTIGNDYENCSTAVTTASNCPGGGESVSSTAFLETRLSCNRCVTLHCVVTPSGPGPIAFVGLPRSSARRLWRELFGLCLSESAVIASRTATRRHSVNLALRPRRRVHRHSGCRNQPHGRWPSDAAAVESRADEGTAGQG